MSKGGAGRAQGTSDVISDMQVPHCESDRLCMWAIVLAVLVIAIMLVGRESPEL